MENNIQPKRIYRHFKGNYYIIEAVGKDANTEKELVIYRNIYDYSGVWVRTLEDFISDIDPDREDNVTGQTKRFIPVNRIE
ncbi:MAG: DUF1653 domain-containing protein [Bacillota bacterium]